MNLPLTGEYALPKFTKEELQAINEIIRLQREEPEKFKILQHELNKSIQKHFKNK